ncbi:MAG TPA: L,D-transpeptidase family protein [Geomonas sp.]|nr:L,D-transpeptidase family protein [Geomonas sp.]
MSRAVVIALRSHWFQLVALCAAIVALNGCVAMKPVEKKSWPQSTHLAKEIERTEFPVPGGDDVIGRLAVVRLEKGDTLPDIARHFSLGINAMSAANPGVDIWAPEAGQRVTLPLSFILPDSPRKGIVVNLATMRLFSYKGAGQSLEVSTYPVGVGTKERPTPIGQMRVERKAARPTWHVPSSIAEDHRKKGDPLPAEVPPGPENPLGEYALYLSKAGYLIHGTNKPASIGLKATNGCMRLYPEDIKILFNDTPARTPVAIVDQPYLIGQRNGVLYLEAHKPLEDAGSGAAALNRLYADLAGIEKKSRRHLNWAKVKETVNEARGIPVPISLESGRETDRPIEVAHPAKLYGKPEVPDLKMGKWYVLAANLPDEMEALRMAAIINHQGPPIPARVLPKSGSYRVVAGPFNDASEAQSAARRLKIDLQIEGVLFEAAKA